MRSEPKIFTGRWLVIAAAVFALGPWLIGWAVRPAGSEFFGAWPKAPGDAAVYYRYIEQGAHQGPLMIDGFTTESQRRIIWQPIWWLAGQSSVGLAIEGPVVFMIWRVLAAALCALTIWWTSGLVFSDPQTRKLAAWLGYFGAGLGGIWSGLRSTSDILKQPVDMWVSESFPWLSSLASPHFLLVTAGLLLVVLGSELAWEQKWVRWLAGPVMLLTISIHPFHIATMVLIWLITSGIERWRDGHWSRAAIKRRLLLLGWAGPGLLYYGLTMFDPVMYQRAIQNINRLPSWWLVVIGILPLAIFAWNSARSRADRRQTALWAWAISIAVLIIMPWPWARRLMQAWAVPLGFLAAAGVLEWLKNGSAARRAVVIGVVALMAITPIKVAADAIITYINDSSSGVTTMSYLTPEYRGLIQYINKHSELGVVLAGKMNGNIIGGLTTVRVYFGSNVETTHAAEKEKMVAEFYGTSNSRKQWEFINLNHICAVLVTPREETYGGKIIAAAWSGARMAYQAKDILLIETGICRSAS